MKKLLLILTLIGIVVLTGYAALSGTYSPNSLFYKPRYGAYGVAEWTEYNNYIDIADVQITANKDNITTISTNIVYCNDYAHPDDAITAIGADNKTLLVTEAETCDTNFTVPANVTVKFERGGKWTINGTGEHNITSTLFSGIGLNDATSGGTFSGGSDIDYKVEIDGTGTPDTFKWSDDGGSTWDATLVAIDGTAQTLNNGVTITFAATTGHTLADSWTFEGIIGVKVTINGSINAGAWQIFDCAGSAYVVFGNNTGIKEVYPEWWETNTTPGTTDMYSALRASIVAAKDYMEVVLQSNVTYLINTELPLYTSRRFQGIKLNGNFATIKAGGAMTSVISLTTPLTIQVQIKNLIINANSQATYGFYAYGIVQSDVLIQNIRVKEATSHGMYLDDCMSIRLENIISQYNGGDGIRLDDCNHLVLDTVMAGNNTLNGITVGQTSYGGGLKLLNVDAEHNSENGIEITDTTGAPVVIMGGWLSLNTKDGIKIGGASEGTYISGNFIAGGDAGGVYRAIRLSSGTKGVYCGGNYFSYASDYSAFASVLDDSGESDNIIFPNFSGKTGAVINNAMQVANLINLNNVDNNTFLGYQAGQNVVAGATKNLYIGYQAGTGGAGSTDAADDNIGLGYLSLDYNTTGESNIAIGTYSLRLNTTGGKNVAIGQDSTKTNSVGNYNTAVGNRSLEAGLSSDNTAIGYQSLLSTTTGGNNVALGNLAGRSNITGTNNTYIGYQAGFNGSQKTDATNSIALGNLAYTTADNQVVLGNSSITETILRGKVKIPVVINNVVTIADGDTTLDVSGGGIFITSANTGATEITDLDNPTVGQIVTLIGGSDTNASTIADAGNFKLSGAMTLGLDDSITLFVKEDNYYIEKSRSVN